MFAGCILCTVCGVSAIAAGCSDASGTVKGGESLLDSGTSTEGGATIPLCIAANARGTGHTFSDLFQDYFGNTSGAACSGSSGACHGDANATGARNSGGFVCPANDKTTCHDTMTTKGLINPGDQAAPENSLLYSTLRKTATGVGTMPKSPLCGFDATDMKRITDWIGAGALND